MKKLIAIISVLIGMCSIKAFAVGTDYERWRSSETCTADTNVRISTTSVIIKDVTVTSGTVQSSVFQYFNSSTTQLEVARSTSVAFDTDTSGTNFKLDEMLSRGFVYTKTGTSCVRIRWDFYGVPPYQRNLGIKP